MKRRYHHKMPQWLPPSAAASSPVPAALAALMSLASCSIIYEYDNCPPEQPFTIEADWAAAPSAQPEGMAYLFFGTDGGAPWRFDYAGREAGRAALPPGSYTMLSYNDDTSAAVIFDEEGGYEAYTVRTASAALPDAATPERQGEQGAECPDAMWGCAYCSVAVDYDGLSFTAAGTPAEGTAPETSPQLVLPARQRRLTPHYSCRVEDVEGLGGVRSLAASLSGMAGALVLHSRQPSAYPRTLLFGARAVGTDAITADFHTFGLPPEPTVPNELSIYVTLRDGRRLRYAFDVTGQVRTAPDPMEVAIVVRGLNIEEPIGGGDEGAFDVGVEGWVTVVVNLSD